MNLRTPQSNDVMLATGPIRARHAFTLTEILIALALVAFLLIGISRIFATVSTTIGTGQALSGAMRTQRSIQQTIASDILGVIPTASNLRPNSGMVPLNDASDVDAGMPFLTISNFRVAAYATDAARRADAIAPVNLQPPVTTTSYASWSRSIRGTDLNGDGTESTTSVSAGGETIPIYLYGDRNFRCDTIGFFTKGLFKSQTGLSNIATGSTTGATYQSSLESPDSFVWYGHMRVFDGTAARLDYSNAYGMPGDPLTPSTTTGVTGPLSNGNNQSATQFVLGRVQMLLVEPVDHDARPGTRAADTSTPDQGVDQKVTWDNTVVATNDPSTPAMFVKRTWWDPTGDLTNGRPVMSPFGSVDPVVLYQPDSTSSAGGCNRALYTDDRTTLNSPKSAVAVQAQQCRTDVVGVDMKSARQRARFLQNYDLGPDGLYGTADDPVTRPTGSSLEWWDYIFVTWQHRYWCNPFLGTTQYDPSQPNINAKSLAERQQILAPGCSQFIVEFAGDFVSQNPDGTIDTSKPNGGVIPDGTPDFVATPVPGTTYYRQSVRWYGLPRDVDGDGHIYTSAAQAAASPDVLPVSVFANAFTTTGHLPFERKSKVGPTIKVVPLPITANDYATNVDEPATATDPSDSGYICVWGPQDFERLYNIGTAAAPNYIRGAYPTLLRFVIEVLDEQGKLKNAVTQELVYPVPNELPTITK